jgi:hypothetical protein
MLPMQKVKDELLARLENENPTNAICCLLDDHDTHIKSHVDVPGLEDHVKEHEEMKNNDTVKLIQEVLKGEI